MSVSVQFGTCKDAVNVLNKKTTFRDAVSCTVKAPILMESPYFIVNSSNINASDNFCYCSDYNRFYWITGTEDLPGGRRGVQCAVDVLSTYNAEIKELSLYVSRRANHDFSNLYDTAMPQLASHEVVIERFSGQLNIVGNSGNATRNYVLTVAGV